MKKYAIDGVFLCKRLTGIQRYALEITKELDKIVPPELVELVIPEYCNDIPQFTNIKIIKYGKHSVRLWEQIDLPRYLKREEAQGIFFENTIPLLYRKGIVTVHDVSLRANQSLFNTSMKGLATVWWRRLMYYAIMHSKMRIVTVSMFSKNEIIKYYQVDVNRITVIYNAWQHIEEVISDESVFKNEKIVPGNYFFAMATLAPNKNFKWILKAAEDNPSDTFVIAGGGQNRNIIEESLQNLNNLVYLGYVSDGVAKALMGNCKAFIFPSFYEGFGIPPLEAVASGCNSLILSDIPCLKEIYEDNAIFVDPYDDHSFNSADLINTVNREKLLGKYSWEKSAIFLKELLES